MESENPPRPRLAYTLAAIVPAIVYTTILGWVVVSRSSVLDIPFARVWVPIIAGLWGVAFVVALGYLGHCLRGWRRHRAGDVEVLRRARSEAVVAEHLVAGLIILAAAPVCLALLFG